MNKVLNRPLFRKEALRKGYIKPIKAYDGRFIGPQPFNAPVPVGMPTGGPIPSNPRTQLMNIPQPAKQGMIRRGLGALTKYGFSLPFYIGSDLTYRALDAGESGKNLSTGAKLTGAGIGGALTAYGASRALPAAMGMGFLPGLAALALYEGGNQLVRAGIRERKRIKAMSPAELAEFKKLNEGRALAGEADIDDSFFNVPVVAKKDLPDVKSKTVVKGEPGSGRIGFGKKVDKQDNLTLADNKEKIGNEEFVNINKVVENEKKKIFDKRPDGADPNSVAPVPPTPGAVESQDKNDNLLSTKEVKEGTVGSTGLTDEGEVAGKKYSSDVITRGKVIAKELLEGRQSQAGLVFLANLASGLLSGKTSQGGIAGALEVMGQALGPAANNYSIMKLKENELENQIMGQALDIALAEYKLANTNEITKGQLGRVQFIGPGGKVRNFDGGINENGIPYLLIGGRQVAAADITGDQLAELYNDPSLKGYNYAQAIIKDKISDDEAKAHRLLLQNIKSKNIVFDVKDIIRATGAAGTKGNLQIALTKLNSLLNDFGLGSTKDAIDRLNSNEESFFRSLELGYQSGEITKDQYKLLKKGFNKKDIQKTIQEAAEKNYKVTDKSTGKLRKPTTNELFELVNAQTTLAYALANSFKDTDRLTQRDVIAAQSIINILPAFGGAETAIASLNALEKDLDRSIDSTINRLERTYFTNAQVMDGFLSLLKGGAGFGKTDSSRVVSPEERMNILEGIQF